MAGPDLENGCILINDEGKLAGKVVYQAEE